MKHMNRTLEAVTAARTRRRAFCRWIQAATVFIAVSVLVPAGQAWAERNAEVERPSRITVAILDFDAFLPGSPDYGRQIGQMLTALLTGEAGFQLVDRSSLERVLQEHELNLTGMVSDAQAVQVGRLVGARVMVTGKAFVMGEQFILTAKLIGTETSLVDGVLVRGAAGDEPTELVLQLANRLNGRLAEAGPRLTADALAAEDPLPGVIEALRQRQLPTVAVVVTEEHIAARPVLAVPDPAVETEIKRLLTQAGVPVKDVPHNQLTDWARRLRDDRRAPWPQGLDGVDVVIIGEAFSEFGARLGNLVSCAARLEINVIRRGDGLIELADRTTTRAIDLSENIAGKTALEKAGRELGLRLLEHWVATLPEAEQVQELREAR
jgi:hypothetical protein